MATAKVFQDGGSQVISLPKEIHFNTEEVYVKRVGNAVMLYPKDKVWETFLAGINSFTDDFISEGRDQGSDQERIHL